MRRKLRELRALCASVADCSHRDTEDTGNIQEVSVHSAPLWQTVATEAQRTQSNYRKVQKASVRSVDLWHLWQRRRDENDTRSSSPRPFGTN